MAAVFADTSALYAVLVDTDQSHTVCREALRAIQAGESPLVTSSFVLHECVALLQARIGLEAVRRFHEGLAPLLEVVWVEQHLYEKAVATLLASGARSISLTDWTSFLLMRSLRISRAFAVDSDFGKQGFQVIPTTRRL